LLILGHNPGLHDFARLLLRDAGSENHRASVKLSEKFPTCAAALFAADEDSIFLPVYFKLQDFLRPKNFS
jgi:phosphohistidine phosphatase